MSGLFGVASTRNCVETLFYGVDYHSHLGTEVAGLAVLGEFFQHRIHALGVNQFKSRFAEEIERMPGASGIGVVSDSNTQPFIVSSRVGDFALVTAGLITNIDELAEGLLATGHSFSEVARGRINPTELVAKTISGGKDLIDGITRVYERIEGSVSMLLLTRDGIIAARDAHGRLPLVVGSGAGAWAVASESCSFPNLGFKVEKFIAPGEIVKVTADGMQILKAAKPGCRICTFLWIYTGYPASAYEGITVESVRERCGALLAKKDTVEADCVSGIPDSGVGHALGYAMESRLPYRRPLVKYTPGYGRSYTPASQDTRDLVAKMKLIPIREIIQGQRIVICEDSIVRGTQLKNLTIQKLWDNGAAEVHMRAACPLSCTPASMRFRRGAKRSSPRGGPSATSREREPWTSHATPIPRRANTRTWSSGSVAISTSRASRISRWQRSRKRSACRASVSARTAGWGERRTESLSA